MFNKVIMAGNLTKDVEIRYLPNGSAVSNTSLATNRKYTLQNGEKKEEVCFIDITFFGRSAEIANQYLRRGSKVLVEGRLSFDQWSDQQGQKRSKHSIVVEAMQMLDSKESDKEWGIQPSSKSETPTPMPPTEKMVFDPLIEDEELLF
ncbi:MAG: single-stranded DNA-binding protein [Sulfurovum sp. FS06-10]|nr:MAG: single-stranded DNA-binding protein [Sulfurovum sp. FS06-10]